METTIVAIIMAILISSSALDWGIAEYSFTAYYTCQK